MVAPAHTAAGAQTHCQPRTAPASALKAPQGAMVPLAPPLLATGRLSRAAHAPSGSRPSQNERAHRLGEAMYVVIVFGRAVGQQISSVEFEHVRCDAKYLLFNGTPRQQVSNRVAF